jgi:hypothetical protein
VIDAVQGFGPRRSEIYLVVATLFRHVLAHQREEREPQPISG